MVHHKALTVVRRTLAPQRMQPSRLFFVWGATGTGKTTAAMNCEPDGELPELCGWSAGRFLTGYTGTNPVVLFDDFDWDKMSVKTWLQLVDRWPFTADIKGGEIKFAPTTIIFTSNDDPRSWWPKAPDATRAAVHRRMDEFGITKEVNEKLEVGAAQTLLRSYFSPTKKPCEEPSDKGKGPALVRSTAKASEAAAGHGPDLRRQESEESLQVCPSEVWGASSDADSSSDGGLTSCSDDSDFEKKRKRFKRGD